MEDKRNLIGPLAHWLAAGKLEPRIVLPAIKTLLPSEAQASSLFRLSETLAVSTDPALADLGRHVLDIVCRESLRIHDKIRRAQPLSADERSALEGLSLGIASEWRLETDPAPLVSAAARVVRDLAFLAANQSKAPALFWEVKNHSAAALAAARAVLLPLLEQVPPDLLKSLERVSSVVAPGRDLLYEFRSRASAGRQKLIENYGRLSQDEGKTRRGEAGDARGVAGSAGVSPASFAGPETQEAEFLTALQSQFKSANRLQQEQILDLVCSWPAPSAATALQAMTTEPWSRQRAVLNLTLRFGRPELASYADWLRWLADQNRLWDERLETLWQLVRQQPELALLVVYSQTSDPEPAILDALVKAVAARMPPVNPQTLIQTWMRTISIPEQRALLGLPEPKPPPIPPLIAQPPPIPPPIPPIAHETPVLPAATPPPEFEEPAPRRPVRPSFWDTHLQPLFVENWYIVAGIVMVILGSSLLAYYTWDKHWLLRYTIMPALLAVFTWSLAGVGDWIEKKGAEFKSTAAILRGAAIGLLPINFMAMALLSADEKVPQKTVALLVMAAIYLSLFGWSLRKWCAAVEPALGNLLGGTLLFLNLLVAIGSLARAVGHLEGTPLLVSLGAGFYVGFVASAAVIVRFTRKILTREMAEEKRVPWFVAAALAITYLQVFVWVHGFMRHVPHAHTYALLVIGVGWLILFAERRALELRESAQLHGGESFLGFAFILLGLLMGFGDARVRILAFIAAGVVWMYQALSRRHPLHYWIALTLFGFGGASVGLLKEFPGPWLPAIGVVLAIGYGLAGWFARRREQPELSRACFGMQVVALVVTTMVAPLTQWHYRSEPLFTALWLLIVAQIFAWRSIKERRIHWLHATMLVLAVALPYAGCMDMAHRSAHHNVMPFGLAVLSFIWLGITRLWPRPLILHARSTVLCFYGALAVAAMLLRVALGDTAPAPLWYRDWMDYTGPILSMLALIPATYHSRSLVPAIMGVAIMAILFPELRANLQESLPWISWGSGLGSSIWGLLLVWLCFFLRRWPFLENLPEGDRFMGKDLFPLRRHDHTLFTWPILAAALFLIIKVDSWNLLTNLLSHGVHLKTAIALFLTGVAWTFFAIYQRAHRGAVVAVHLGWLCALAGINFAYWDKAGDPQWSWPFLITGCLFQVLYWIYRYHLEAIQPWARALLTEPMRMVLLTGSGALAIVCIFCLVQGAAFEPIQWLNAFVAAQLVWHALRARHLVFGTILFLQIWTALLAISAPGVGPLWERVSVALSFAPTLWLFIGIQLIFIGLEFAGGARAVLGSQQPRSEEKRRSQEAAPNVSDPLRADDGSRSVHDTAFQTFLSPLLTPSFFLASAITFLLGLAGILDGLHLQSLLPNQVLLLAVTLLLTARAQVSTPFLLVAILLGYVAIHRNQLVALQGPEQILTFLATPWRLSCLGLVMVVVMEALCWLKQLSPSPAREESAEQRRPFQFLVTGPFSLPFFRAPFRGVLFWPALLFVTAAALYHAFDPVLRENRSQLWAPYVGALAFALVAWFWKRSRFFAGAGVLLLLGNIHLVRIFAGDFLRAHGISELHLICLGIALTLLQASVLIRVLRDQQAISTLNLASLGLAFLILVLLSANYFTAPDLAAMKSTRFIVSGALAWLAGQYFRRAARHPGPGEKAHVDLCEAFYHFGLVLAIWCAALLIPWLRQPMFTLVALGLPVLHFYRRAEMGSRLGEVQARRYRNSAAVLSFVLLGLYLFKGIFHMVLYPGAAISTQYYHYNAPIILVLGVIMLRLHGLGGTVWLAFYGGLALMTGSYFCLTALPGLSPFDYPVPSAWSAIILAHFWILVSYARSPLRGIIQRLARLDDSVWHSLRHYWGICLLIATQGATLWGISDYERDTYMAAPLLAAAATIFIHQGIIRLLLIRSRRGNEAQISPDATGPGGSQSLVTSAATIFNYGILYLVIAALELTLALHMDFLTPSYLKKDEIIWVLLLLWVAVLVVHQIRIAVRTRMSPSAATSARTQAPEQSNAPGTAKLAADGAVRTPGVIVPYLAALVFIHIVFQHHPWKPVGLWAMAIAGVLAASTPVSVPGVGVSEYRRVGVERFFAALILWIPTWLVYFSQAAIETRGVDGTLDPWPVLAATAAIFLTGLFGRVFSTHLAPLYNRIILSSGNSKGLLSPALSSEGGEGEDTVGSVGERSRSPGGEGLGVRGDSFLFRQFRLFDSTLNWLQCHGRLLFRITLWITLIVAGAVQVFHYNDALAPREFGLLVLLEAALAVSWFYEGKDRDSMLAYYLMQISAVACFGCIRRHLMLTTTFWNYEYDIWASLAFSFVLAGAKQIFDLQPRSLRFPLLTSMIVLPVLALVWVLVHGLGVNLALLVVGLHSVLFAYLGKGDRESPYNIVALSGFVAFILMTFYSKLHLKAVHAYIIPVGLGILVLQELFRSRIKPDARNWIRLVTLMAMLGSSGYYALADPRHGITFNLTMIVLCLLAMGLGSFMQIRLYLALGFAGLMVDLISILYKVLVHMERSARMTIIGGLVLVIGAVLVFGAIYYKTKKAQLDAWVQKSRDKLKAWE